MPVAVFDGADDLLEKAPAFVFRHSAPVDYVLKQLSPSILRQGVSASHSTACTPSLPTSMTMMMSEGVVMTSYSLMMWG